MMIILILKIYPSVFVLFNHFVSAWLEDDFGILGYLENWEKCVKARKGFTKAAAKKCFLVQKLVLVYD